MILTTFLGGRDIASVNSDVRREFLSDHRPALTVVIAEIFDPAWLLEIEAIAAAPQYDARRPPRTRHRTYRPRLE